MIRMNNLYNKGILNIQEYICSFCIDKEVKKQKVFQYLMMHNNNKIYQKRLVKIRQDQSI
ncbi:unnamed protein product [Paramecium sonneborni]|uniref:Uncharacterized protein n=1 Tax=Paramecium sonneborni TaxID=65129 RepID=A0A8S1L7H0_9CILI|nr:unnamed protein product [Paramecium sonneborni]